MVSKTLLFLVVVSLLVQEAYLQASPSRRALSSTFRCRRATWSHTLTRTISGQACRALVRTVGCWGYCPSFQYKRLLGTIVSSNGADHSINKRCSCCKATVLRTRIRTVSFRCQTFTRNVRLAIPWALRCACTTC